MHDLHRSNMLYKISISGLTNLRHERLGTRHSLLYQFFIALRPYIVKKRCVYTHISDCVQIVFELPLLRSKNKKWNIFTQIRAVRSVDWIFIVVAPAWRWQRQYMILGRSFYSLLLKHEAVSNTVSSKSVGNCSTCPQKLSPALIYCYSHYKCMSN
jgi:hypothetical protein